MSLKFSAVIFCYNRPDKLRALLQSCGTALQGRSLYLVIDGAKNQNDEALQSNLLKVFYDFTRNSNIKVVQHPSNLGPRFAIPLGLKKVFEDCDSVIILEEDLVVSELFFAFADKALHEISRSSELSGFSGYMVPISDKEDHAMQLDVNPSNIFWPWGWGTTKAAWKHYQDELESFSMRDFYRLSRVLSSCCFVRASWTLMLILTKQDKNNSWFYRWQVQCCRKRMRFLVPSQNLVANAGCDVSATHTSKLKEPSGGHILKSSDRITIHPEPISELKQDLFYTTANALTAVKFVRMFISALVPKTIFRGIRAAFR